MLNFLCRKSWEVQITEEEVLIKGEEMRCFGNPGEVFGEYRQKCAAEKLNGDYISLSSDEVH